MNRRPRRVEPPVRNALRVVAGELAGRRLAAPGGDNTRPTSDRTREAIFNALGSMDVIEGARTIDAFAGSGALGIEALSRGAVSATFVERDAPARRVIHDNVTALGLEDRCVVRAGDAIAELRGGGAWDLILLDPPYAYDGWDDLLAVVADGLAPFGVAVLESDRELALPEGLHVLKIRRYGSTVVTFVSTTGADS